jgi:hypothetical protein
MRSHKASAATAYGSTPPNRTIFSMKLSPRAQSKIFHTANKFEMI